MRKIITKILFALGIILISLSVLVVVHSYVSQKKANKEIPQIVSSLYDLMPETHGGYLDDRADYSMPSVELNKKDYMGVIEIPLYHITLPFKANWDSKDAETIPCRYYGSIYNGSLIIGASESNIRCSDVISIGDDITVTDMTGAMFSYTVSDIIITDIIEAEALTNENADLTLFVKDALSNEYTIIFCNL